MKKKPFIMWEKTELCTNVFCHLCITLMFILPTLHSCEKYEKPSDEGMILGEWEGYVYHWVSKRWNRQT